MTFNPAQPRDDDGKWTAYHQTSSRFTEFDDEAMGKRDPGDLGRGHYFTTDPRTSPGLGSEQMEVRLSPRNPLELLRTNWRDYKPTIIRNALGLPASATAAEVTAELKRRGFDSVILDNSPVGYHHHEIMMVDSSRITYLRHVNDGNGPTITRSAFDALTPTQKMTAVKAGARVV